MSSTSAALVRTQAVSPELGVTWVPPWGPGSAQEVGRGGLPTDAPKVSGVYPSVRSGYGLVTYRWLPQSSCRNTRTAAKVARKAPNPPEAACRNGRIANSSQTPTPPTAPATAAARTRRRNGRRAGCASPCGCNDRRGWSPSMPSTSASSRSVSLGSSPGVRCAAMAPSCLARGPAAEVCWRRVLLGGVAEQRVDEDLGVEGRQVVGALAQADQLHRHAQLALDRDHDAALGRPVELGEHDAGDVDDLGEHPGLDQAVLPGGGVQDEQHLVDGP